MTIAACYLSSEGVVLGADSTSTFRGSRQGRSERHYNHAQKLFEIGDRSTLGIVTWGLGGLGDCSWRTLVANFGDSLAAKPPTSPDEVATRWRDLLWKEFLTRYSGEMHRCHDLLRMTSRTPDEDDELDWLLNLSGGFCLAGRIGNDRMPFAYEIRYGPRGLPDAPPVPIERNSPQFWGCPNLINRILYGVDADVFDRISQSPLWKGSPQELFEIVRGGILDPPGTLPLRDAIDWIHSSILTTIKAMRFSQLAPICGGPIEVATITTDRPFRWVCHKGLDEAVDHHRPRQRT